VTVTDDGDSCLLISFLVVSLVLGWSVDHVRLQRELTRTKQELARTTEIAGFGKRELFKHMRRPDVIGMAVAEFPEVQRFADETLDETSNDPFASHLWEKTRKHWTGRSCKGYYFYTPEYFEEGLPGFYVLTVDGRIILVEADNPCW
jgi:hypothetical protein